MMKHRIIGHLDMDAFFAAVEEREHESLRGLPIVVGADPEEGRGRGVVSTANYRAREYGIHSAMPISVAWRLAESARLRGLAPAMFVRTSFDLYRATSQRIMTIIREYAGALEEASIDEAYFDLPPRTGHQRDFAEARAGAVEIKKRIRAEEGLTCSIGIGPNKLIAKIASDMEKPDGLTVVEPRDVEVFLDPLPLRKIPGIGPKAEEVFRQKGMTHVRDLKQLSREELEEIMGKPGSNSSAASAHAALGGSRRLLPGTWGRSLYEKIRGIDERPITESYETKSIGEQETFAQDTLDPGFLFERLNAMCAGVHRRLQAEGFQGFRTVVATVRFADFETLSRSRTLSAATDALQTLQFEAMRLVVPFLDARENPKRKQIRLLGIRAEKLT